MWSKRWYYYFLILLRKRYNIHPVDFLAEAAEMAKSENSIFYPVYKEFMNDYTEAENFETEKELEEYWSKPKNFQRLKDGTYGKLNMLYTYKVVLEHKELFSKCLTICL